MWHGPSPKIAWYWFSPSTAKHRAPPFLRHANSSLRKYQHRGRWLRLPPTVPTLRICGVPTSSAACASAGKLRCTSACAARSASVTADPMRNPPSGVLAIVRSRFFTFTRRSGSTMWSFIIARRSMPPASGSLRPRSGPSAPIASFSFAGLTYAKAFTACLLPSPRSARRAPPPASAADCGPGRRSRSRRRCRRRPPSR